MENNDRISSIKRIKLLLLFNTLQCTYVAILYLQTSTMIEFISCTDGPPATGPVTNVMYII